MFALKGPRTGKKYSDEPIHLKAIGVEIRGKSIFCRGVKTIVSITDTDRHLIYFLYSKYGRDSDERSTLDQLAGEPFDENERKNDGYIKNRIVEINKAIKRAIGIKGKTVVASFIKYEVGRGYRLNPKVMEVGLGSKGNHKIQGAARSR